MQYFKVREGYGSEPNLEIVEFQVVKETPRTVVLKEQKITRNNGRPAAYPWGYQRTKRKSDLASDGICPTLLEALRAYRDDLSERIMALKAKNAVVATLGVQISGLIEEEVARGG